MAYNLSLNEFEDMNMYSNKTMEKIISGIVNESSNAAFVAMADDSVVLFDHLEGKFYVGDYNFSKEDLTLKLENFDEIIIHKNEDEFKGSVLDFFEDNSLSVFDLTESYKENVLKKDKYLEDLIGEAMTAKNFEGKVDYDEISEAVTELKGELKSFNSEYFKEYTERLGTHPLETIKRFDWAKPSVVSLIETEEIKVINSSIKEKAKGLWKSKEFKEGFCDAVRMFIEDVESGNDALVALFEEYPQALYLGKADRNILFGKSLISDSELKESRKEIIKGIDVLFERYELSEMREELILEAEEGTEEGGEPAADAPAEVEDKDCDNLANDLKKVAEKCEDEDTKKELEKLISKVEKGKDEGTRPEVVKEAVSILNL